MVNGEDHYVEIFRVNLKVVVTYFLLFFTRHSLEDGTGFCASLVERQNPRNEARKFVMQDVIPKSLCTLNSVLTPLVLRECHWQDVQSTAFAI